MENALIHNYHHDSSDDEQSDDEHIEDNEVNDQQEEAVDDDARAQQIERVAQHILHSINRMHRSCNLSNEHLSDQTFEQVLQLLHRMHVHPSASVLWDISLVNNHLTAIPRVLELVATLGILNMSSNQLTVLHDEFASGLAHLQRINLANNRIGCLPRSLHGMGHRLTHINLNHNDLHSSSLWPLTHLQALQVLELADNQITSIDYGWGAALSTRLVFLNLEANQLPWIEETTINIERRRQSGVRVALAHNPWAAVETLNVQCRPPTTQAATTATNTEQQPPTEATTATSSDDHPSSPSFQPFTAPTLKELAIRVICQSASLTASQLPSSIDYPYELPHITSNPKSTATKKQQSARMQQRMAKPTLPRELQDLLQTAKPCAHCNHPYVAYALQCYRRTANNIVVQVLVCSSKCLLQVVLREENA
jgi:hypothetical protein